MKGLVAFIIFSLLTTLGFGQPANTDFTVAKDGSGDFTTVQEAIDASPNNSSNHTLIFIKNGEYEEPLNVGASKTNLILYGEDQENVVLTYKTEETLDLATLEVYATGFIAYNLTIENTAGPTYGPAQALRQEADKSIYINCSLLGNQDTYRNSEIRSYNKNCYIEGTVDFIFGDGTVVFEDCVLYSKGGSAITAASTEEFVDYGYVFRNCRIVSERNTTTHLGRPWKDFAAVAYLNCEMPREIMSAGWHNWGEPDREATSRFAEYKNYGPGADISNRVEWATMLTEEEAGEYATLNVLKTTYNDPPTVDNWNPYETIENAGIPGLNIEGDGYGANEGGNGGTTVTVDNETDLKTYAASNDKYIIRVSGNIELSGRVDIGSNTTITGIDEKSGISGDALNITDNHQNIIIKYLNVSNPNGDGITVWNGQNVYITHVSFTDCGDGSCDINRGSDSVTVSWCKFAYPGQDDHRFTMIADGAMTWNDDGEVISYGNKLHLTLHHNWWYSRSDQRMPASTNARIHMYNNYWNCIGNSYCSNARHLSEFYSENNYYDHVKNPIYGESGGVVYTNGNVYNNCSGQIADGTDSVFTPQYPYTLSDVNHVPYIVTSRAGNVWDNPKQYNITAQSEGNGEVSPGGNNTYNEGQLVSIEASPYNDNSQFTGWEGYSNANTNPLVFYADSSYEITANFETTIGIANTSSDNINIYPNPSVDGHFFLDIGQESGKTVTIKIYSLASKLVFQQEYKQHQGVLEIQSNLDSGTYIIEIEKLKGERFTELISIK